MATPSQAYDHVLQLVSGPREMNTLQYGASYKTGESFPAGALVSLDSNGEIVAGVGDADMPLFAINGTSDYDVTSDGIAYGGGLNIIGGQINCYVGTGGYELFTSEYDTTAAANMVPNAKLTGTSYKLTVSAALYNDKNVVGVVSKGVVTDQYGKGVLRFWPCFLPKVATTTSGTGATGASGATGATGATGPA